MSQEFERFLWKVHFGLPWLFAIAFCHNSLYMPLKHSLFQQFSFNNPHFSCLLLSLISFERENHPIQLISCPVTFNCNPNVMIYNHFIIKKKKFCQVCHFIQFLHLQYSFKYTSVMKTFIKNMVQLDCCAGI